MADDNKKAKAPRIVFVDMKIRAGGIAGDDTLTPTLTPQVFGDKEPLFLRVEASLRTMLQWRTPVPDRLTHIDGKLNSQCKGDQQPFTELTAAEEVLAAVYGILEREGVNNPDVENFQTALAMGLGEYTRDKDLFHRALDILIQAGSVEVKRVNQVSTSPDLELVCERQVQADLWAKVVQRLRERGIGHDDCNLSEIATGILVGLRAADGGLDPSAIEIQLPDLEDKATVEIIAENLQALQAVYFSAMLEELRVFQVVDKLIEMFHQGMLPVGRGKAGDILYRYWKSSNERFTEAERRNLYARAFGYPGGDPNVPPNREFGDLWLRFIAAVSSFARQTSLENLLTSVVPTSVSQETIRRSGRDLAANLSLHGYGIAYFAATELQQQINEIRELLSSLEIRNAFGAGDMFQVIDQVATLELGGARNSIRYRTLANTGAIIIRWLANNRTKLASAQQLKVLNDRQGSDLREERTAAYYGKKTTVEPTDFDLVNACTQWLAVTGTPEQKVEEYSQPSEPPMMTSRPIAMPSVAKDLLESAGVSLGLPAPPQRAHGNGRYAVK